MVDICKTVMKKVIYIAWNIGEYRARSLKFRGRRGGDFGADFES